MALLADASRGLHQVAAWFSGAHLIPWVGLLAVVLAAATLAPRTWLKSPRLALGRTLQVAGIWLALVVLVSLLGPREPQAPTGPAAGTENQGTTPEILPVVGSFPAGISASVVLVIRFLPLSPESTVARDFCCDVFPRNGAPLPVRASNMEGFEKQLVAVLRRVSLPRDVPQPEVSIQRNPYPGEGVLRKVGQKVRSVFPDVRLRFDEQQVP